MDINCDMGEGFGSWKMPAGLREGNDAALMDFVTSINIACGFHAGDASIMRKTAKLALEKGVKIGAHPGYPDLQGFGRRTMSFSHAEVFDFCVYQIGAMKAIAEATGGKLHHVKPHGALYNTAAKNEQMANAIAKAVQAVDENLILYGLANSLLITEAEKIGVKTAAEAFADRTYQPDGSLTPRNEPNALIQTVDACVRQVKQLIEEQTLTCTDGSAIPLKAETICIHGDGEHALAFAKAVWGIVK